MIGFEGMGQNAESAQDFQTVNKIFLAAQIWLG